MNNEILQEGTDHFFPFFSQKVIFFTLFCYFFLQVLFFFHFHHVAHLFLRFVNAEILYN